MRFAHASSHRGTDHTAADSHRANNRRGDCNTRAYINADIYLTAHGDGSAHGYRYAFANTAADFQANRSTDRYRDCYTYRDANPNAGIHPYPDWGIAGAHGRGSDGDWYSGGNGQPLAGIQVYVG